MWFICPDESKYYKLERNKNFIIFYNSDLIIFWSPFHTKLFMQYHEDIFAYGTYYILHLNLVSKCS